VLTTAPSSPLAERLAELLCELRLLFARLSPEVVVVERVLFQTNARTAMSVGQASGLALAAAAEAGIPVTQYSPNEVKQAVTGWGNAGKDQVQRMVQVLLDLPEKPSPPDIADALALALCHLASAPLMRAAQAARGGASYKGAKPAQPAAAHKPVPRLDQAGPGEVPAITGGRR
jgi:crossover junction endodeoxyribonuclease RuvC